MAYFIIVIRKKSQFEVFTEFLMTISVTCEMTHV